MTPLAAKVAKQLLLPVKKRTDYKADAALVEGVTTWPR